MSVEHRKALMTVTGKKHLPRAIMALESFARWHSDWDVWIVFSDDPEGHFQLLDLKFPVIPAAELADSATPAYRFAYSESEYAKSLKAHGLLWLLEKKGYQQVIYLDSDTYTYARFEEVERILDSGKVSTLLSPHQSEPPGPGAWCSASDMMSAGAYNSGFLAFSNRPQALALLKWWRDQLYPALPNPAWTSFDQRWLNLAHSYFEEIELLKDPGYNTSFWNLSQRPLGLGPQGYTCAGRPLVFYHFSGYNPNIPTRASGDAANLNPQATAPMDKIFADYRAELLASPWSEIAGKGYAFGHFSDGMPVETLQRRRFGRDAELRKLAGADPFQQPGLFYTDLRRARFREALFKARDIIPRSWRHKLLPPGLRRAMERLLKA